MGRMCDCKFVKEDGLHDTGHVKGIGKRIAPDGLFVESIRDYDRLLEENAGGDRILPAYCGCEEIVVLN